MIEDNARIKIENLSSGTVGFGCSNFPNHYDLAPGQTIAVKWEHLADAMFTRGMRAFIEQGYLRISPKNDNYDEIMEELQLSSVKAVSEQSMKLDEVKKLLSTSPLQIAYSKIKTALANGSVGTRENFAQAAVELKIRDYSVNKLIKEYTDIDVIKILDLNEIESDEIAGEVN